MNKLSKSSLLFFGLQFFLSHSLFASPVPIKVTVLRPAIKQYFYPTSEAGVYNLKKQDTDKISVNFESLEEQESRKGRKKWKKNYTLKEAKAFPAQLIFKEHHRHYGHDSLVFVDTDVKKVTSRKIFRAGPAALPPGCPEGHKLRHTTVLTPENEHAQTGDTLDLFIRGFLAYAGKGKILIVDPKMTVTPAKPKKEDVTLRVKPNGAIVVKYPALKIEFYASRDKNAIEDYFRGPIDLGQGKFN